MTKQEKIREGVLNIVAEPVDITLGQMTDEILSYLHSQGVVLKVERELPNWFCIALHPDGCPILKAGCCAVEPLIKGE